MRRRIPVPAVLRPFLVFLVVGTIGFAIDAGGCAALIGAGLPPLAARLPSMIAAIAATFLLNRSFTFRSRGSLAHEAARYLGVYAAGASLNYGVFALALALEPGLPPILALALGTGVALGWNFLASRGLVFTAPALARSDQAP